MKCRPGCAACCIAPSISSFIPGHPNGKPAGVACVHLTADLLCSLFDSPLRPAVCTSFPPKEDACKMSREAALEALAAMEKATVP
ncbi:MAG: YkgJ family cysteine cluster protein [Spirochaetales bacterium]|nr:YkgJ family cysteine cluster protein [Spirochaetales bacterium]